MREGQKRRRKRKDDGRDLDILGVGLLESGINVPIEGEGGGATNDTFDLSTRVVLGLLGKLLE